MLKNHWITDFIESYICNCTLVKLLKNLSKQPEISSKTKGSDVFFLIIGEYMFYFYFKKWAVSPTKSLPNHHWEPDKCISQLNRLKGIPKKLTSIPTPTSPPCNHILTQLGERKNTAFGWCASLYFYRLPIIVLVDFVWFVLTFLYKTDCPWIMVRMYGPCKSGVKDDVSFKHKGS